MCALQCMYTHTHSHNGQIYYRDFVTIMIIFWRQKIWVLLSNVFPLSPVSISFSSCVTSEVIIASEWALLQRERGKDNYVQNYNIEETGRNVFMLRYTWLLAYPSSMANSSSSSLLSCPSLFLSMESNTRRSCLLSFWSMRFNRLLDG